jgi:phosphate:Na+ symporter
MPESEPPRRGTRALVAWFLTLLVLGIYASLPSGSDPARLFADGETPARASDLEVVEVSPPTAAPGEAVTVRVAGAAEIAKLKAFAGKQELEVLARRDDGLVVRLPNDRGARRIKIRVADAKERSKPYDIQLEPPNLRKSFRNLVGGLALLVFGISLFARGAREALGPASARLLRRVAARTPTALVAGVLLGALAQSTTAAAGVLSGLVAMQLAAVSSAAAAFLGAGLGAATAPLVTGLVDAREGLLVVALGGVWVSIANDRRSTALGSVALGAGLLTFGLHLLRQGFEPFVSHPALLPFVDHLRADSLGGVLLCVLLGVLLVAALQGPAPVIVLVLGFAETTGHWDLATCLAVLSGTGLGSALAALVTTRASPRSRDLAKLELLLGAASTVFVALSLGLWTSLAERLLAGSASDVSWGRRVLLPNLGPHLALAFGLSQLAAAFVLLPAIPRLRSVLEQLSAARAARKLARAGDPTGVVRASLLSALRRLSPALESIAELWGRCSRDEGRAAEHRLADAREELEAALNGPLRELPKSSETERLGGALLACFQLRRALEGLLFHAERLADDRIALGDARPARDDDERILVKMHAALLDSLAVLGESVETRTPPDIEAARAREIIMNGLEARARGAALVVGHDAGPRRVEAHLLDLIDAYEAAGNQAYRLAEVLGAPYLPDTLVEAV